MSAEPTTTGPRFIRCGDCACAFEGQCHRHAPRPWFDTLPPFIPGVTTGSQTPIHVYWPSAVSGCCEGTPRDCDH